jgi:hypothetical protein
MKYLLQIIFVAFIFFICRKEKAKFTSAINEKKYNFGIYIFNPLTGNDAVNKAKLGLFLSKIIPWLFVLIFIAYNIREFM